MIFGIILGWTAPVAEDVTKHQILGFSVSNNQFALITSLASLGSMASCVLSGVMRSRFGTSTMILIFAIPVLIGWILIIFPQNVSMVS